MTLTLTVFAITLPFLRAQTRGLEGSAGRLDADQIARYAQRAIDRELRLAVADSGQPLLVYAGRMGIAFTANLIAADVTDPEAAEYEASAATTLSEAWRLADAAPVAGSARSFPAQDYVGKDSAISRNETIAYFLHPDTISGRSDLYVLYRRVNARDSVQIVRSIHVPTDSSFFEYLRPVSGALTSIATTRLPLYWDSTAIDSVSAVNIRSGGFYRNRVTGAESIRTVRWRTALSNSAGRVVESCAVVPGVASSISPSQQTSPRLHVRLSWNAAANDNGAVEAYLVGIRPAAGTDWIVLANVPARSASTYRWEHYLPSQTGSVKYGIRSIACSNNRSAWVTHNSNLTLP